jgi:hypothetical protein
MAIFGIGQQKPHHYREMARAVWENRDQLPFAWRILRDGVCDGCALGTSGLSDWTVPGTHLCMVRLELMRLNTAPAFSPAILRDVQPLAGRTSAELRDLGRLSTPMLRARGARGFDAVMPRHHAQDSPARYHALCFHLRDQSRRQLRSPLPRRLDVGHEGDARTWRRHLQLHRLAPRRSHRAVRQ